MDIFQHIHIHGGILEQVKLYNLGKINIFCGKNNSGKSTVLNSLSDINNVQIGIMIDTSLMGEILVLVSDHLNAFLNEPSAVEELTEIFQDKIFPFEIDYNVLGLWCSKYAVTLGVYNKCCKENSIFQEVK